ncbi:MAG: glycosyltransferase family 4 protein [Gammaproteobacteria bacterium]
MSIRESQGWLPDDHVILFIAQHNWVKGPDIAMDIFRQVAKSDSKARFLIVGSGRMTDAMKIYARQYFSSGTIHFAGFVPSEKTVAYYLASDLVICPSRYETWARMVNEAMLCRRPCLVSRIVAAAGGLIVNGENGYVVDAPEVSQFVTAIKKHFMLPQEVRQQMGESAREKAQDFAYGPHIDNVVAAARYAFEQVQSKRSKKVSR